MSLYKAQAGCSAREDEAILSGVFCSFCSHTVAMLRAPQVNSWTVNIWQLTAQLAFKRKSCSEPLGGHRL
uniref:Uncharacterized protein n=1 Tax=Knipowitschia caucasica TaxID=637954 RepID=A0AAV2MK82_KNICA